MKGRPTKADADRRENVLRIRLTDAERRALDKAAEARTLDTSTWARMTLLSVTRGGTDETAGTAVKPSRRAGG